MDFALFLFFFNSLTVAGICKTPTTVNRLTEAVKATASVKATINCDLCAEVVAKTASVNPKCPPP
jgi:hypothetical protein